MFCYGNHRYILDFKRKYENPLATATPFYTDLFLNLPLPRIRIRTSTWIHFRPLFYRSIFPRKMFIEFEKEMINTNDCFLIPTFFKNWIDRPHNYTVHSDPKVVVIENSSL